MLGFAFILKTFKKLNELELDLKFLEWSPLNIILTVFFLYCTRLGTLTPPSTDIVECPPSAQNVAECLLRAVRGFKKYSYHVIYEILRHLCRKLWFFRIWLKMGTLSPPSGDIVEGRQRDENVAEDLDCAVRGFKKSCDLFITFF